MNIFNDGFINELENIFRSRRNVVKALVLLNQKQSHDCPIVSLLIKYLLLMQDL